MKYSDESNKLKSEAKKKYYAMRRKTGPDGFKLKEWRIQNNLSRSDLANTLGCNMASVGAWERKDRIMNNKSQSDFKRVYGFDPAVKFKRSGENQ